MPNQAIAPITVVNETGDKAQLPEDFMFVTDMVLGQGVEPAEASFRSGCSCLDPKDCQYNGCHCLGELEDEEEDDGDEQAGETTDLSRQSRALSGDGTVGANDKGRREKRQKKRYSYYTHGEQAGRLRSSMMNSHTPLYECHSGCSCRSSCPNRVVERGRTIPLEIFRTKDRGWGK